MYQYDALDSQLVNERVAQFRDQVARWKAGAQSDHDLDQRRIGDVADKELADQFAEQAQYEENEGHFARAARAKVSG